MDPASLLRKAEEESNIWIELNYPDARSSAPWSLLDRKELQRKGFNAWQEILFIRSIQRTCRALSYLLGHREHEFHANVLAQRIATSVTVDHRYQYYIASGGPNWLNDLIAYEARNAAPPS
ncbi:hypothetical protein F2Q68_00019437 [Brassica cretica]|uniref:Uncharacterized protein n=1 Tax=Brassica cretica TaxID=69181 RepID=A0A8S9G2A0_BRACR|nr:hypothetical protein F2Q68_00019437 [Brassica cretica]